MGEVHFLQLCGVVLGTPAPRFFARAFEFPG